MHDVNESARLSIALATAEQIRMWSNGEVKKPETINYRTLKPEKDGLFCEKIFGPTKDWECYCGKYKRVRFKGIICERCGVEVTRSKVRRERMGHIELAAPVTHIWYFKGVPSRLGYLLDIAPKTLEKVIYFAAHLITSVDEEHRHKDMPELEADIRGEFEDFEKERATRLAARDQEFEKEIEELEKASPSGNARKADLERAEKARAKDVEEINDRVNAEVEHLKTVWITFEKLAPKQIVDDERVWRDLRDRFDEYFTGAMGAEAVKDLISRLEMSEEEQGLKETIATAKGQRKAKAIKRLKVTSAFNRLDMHGKTINSPMGMVLDAVPVIPPDLRPMVQLDGGRFATSDLNDLYRRVINRNNRLKRLLDLGAPEIIINNEKRMLQEAVDALFDNGRRGRPVTGPGNRALKSLSDMLKGKQGRFRQNLLGKRVDYSGRSVIVVGPQLKLQQCGLPKQMALELFKPFVMKRLVDLEFAQNIKSAKRMVERARPQVWDVLEEVIKEHPVFLNRAPTLHRLGIQAFEPVLVEGKAIQIHPLVCAAFNADFDGDQMAVHLPLSSEAQAEARILMLSAHNILSPAHGRPIAVPSQDMIIGCYYLTEVVDGAHGEGRVFSSLDEAVLAYDQRHTGENGSGPDGIDLHAKIKVRMPAGRFPADEFPARDAKNEDRVVVRGDDGNGTVIVESTLGRFLFNEAFPPDFPFQGATARAGLKKRELTAIVSELVERYSRAEVATSLDNLKDLGFEFSTRAGLTISMADVKTPSTKGQLLEHFEAEADKIEQQYDRGIITDDERRQKEIEIWTDATDQVKDAMEAEMSSEQFNPIDMMVGSGARGNIVQVRQIAGMRGLVANPRGEIIPRPVKSSFREGLSVLEYFISTHGARKGLADTALRTADSGYLTRRLVDVAQELIIREEDCEATRGIWVEGITPDADTRFLDTRLLGRCLLEDVKLSDGSTMPRNTEIQDEHVEALKMDGKEGIGRVRVRSVLTCDSLTGLCARCYGTMLATGKPVDLGEAVGIIAAQSIGEPGTQLTMRTFHTGGVAGEDITHGLPRVVELFEARSPKVYIGLASVSGTVHLSENDRGEPVIHVVTDKGEEVLQDPSAFSTQRHIFYPLVKHGVDVEVGDPLMTTMRHARQYAAVRGPESATAYAEDMPRNPKELLEVAGIRATQQYLADEVQRVYREQGVSIHDKHVEVIVRQMLRRVAVSEPGDSPFLPGEKVDARLYAEMNRQLVEDGKQPAEGRPELMGITKASLATDSWLSAASFQETTRVLTEAAIEGKTDGLFGLKENVIIGKLIPAGTGMPVYREITTEAPDYEPLPFYSTDIDAEAMAAYLRDSIGTPDPLAPSAGGAVIGEAEDYGTIAPVVELPEQGYEGTGTEE
ncbi:MAG: DNA-directed RNA polymerase subunit beta' [Actinobacteria bacterium]|nr:DNA-directed RNA polymerase subunit beta' [Actinomycetota bacterium]